MNAFTVRASAWGALFDCAMKFEGEHLLGMRKASGLRAALGTAVHASTAANDQARLDGNPLTPDDTAGVLIDALHNPTQDVDYRDDDLTVRDAERIGLALHTRYCLDIAPQFEYTAVEMKLAPFEIDCGGGTVVRLTGSMDRARVAQREDGIAIPDLKTGRAIIQNGKVNTKGKAAQLGTYQLLYENTTGEQTVGGQIIGLPTTGKANPMVSPLFDARRVMLGTDGQRGLIEYAAEMFRSGLFPPNPQSVLCSPKFCARWKTCMFHE
ncbi:RecB family exonuclease [Paraburkholderia dioscoreae]|uniref:PD-(D/E)XK nuclease superfamily protein n=1 Tax=Paraburkholderia dioscoreae TaxID=2604047 RepID=A0A5Q4ZEB3_9BURK|nr:PD-(D/E)XK nuclease family protein [Paraburkholderia dioscoreae]VVD29203.1 PD-(D/E)XK nuclease superfamily protein [Paraburkholderia dioscoreae]